MPSLQSPQCSTVNFACHQRSTSNRQVRHVPVLSRSLQLSLPVSSSACPLASHALAGHSNIFTVHLSGEHTSIRATCPAQFRFLRRCSSTQSRHFARSSAVSAIAVTLFRYSTHVSVFSLSCALSSSSSALPCLPPPPHFAPLLLFDVEI